VASALNSVPEKGAISPLLTVITLGSAYAKDTSKNANIILNPHF
jgi:hypothetical protein